MGDPINPAEAREAIARVMAKLVNKYTKHDAPILGYVHHTAGHIEEAADAILALPFIQGMREEVKRLRTAISWLDAAFVDETTPPSEIMTRIKFMRADARRAAEVYASLNHEPHPPGEGGTS